MSFALLSVTDNGGTYAPSPELVPRLSLVNASLRGGPLFRFSRLRLRLGLHHRVEGLLESLPCVGKFLDIFWLRRRLVCFHRGSIPWPLRLAERRPIRGKIRRMAHNIQRMALAEKMIGSEPAWHFDGHDGKRLRLSVPLAISDVIEEGLYLDCHCPSDNPDIDVSVNLTFKPSYGDAGALCRVDWNPLQPHYNQGRVSGEWRLRPIRTSHLHSFPENFVKGLKIMFRYNLPVAFPIIEPLPNFREMLSV